MEIQLDINNPFLFSNVGKKRKEEIIMSFFQHHPLLPIHASKCPIMRDGNLEKDCKVCEKFSCMVNILLQEEQKMNKKLDIKGMVEKGIVEYMIFGDGIEIRNK